MSILSSAIRRITETGDQRLLRTSVSEHEKRNPDHLVSRIAECEPGSEVTVAGTVENVSVRLEGSSPALEVSIQDGSGHVFVVWLGRRRISGVHEGRHLVIHGRLNCVTDHPTIYNPQYELLPE
jgi:RecG-like helicase